MKHRGHDRQLPPPEWSPSNARGGHFDWRKLLMPASLTLLVFLYFLFHTPLWVIAPLALLAPGFTIWSQTKLKRDLPEFERQFSLHMQRQDVRALGKLWRDSRMLRWLMPPWLRDVRLGMIFSLSGRHRHAERLLESAWISAPAQARAQLLGPLVRVKYAVGEYEDLWILARQWRQHAMFPATANLYLAAAMLERADCDQDDVEELLSEASSSSLTPQDQALHDELEALLEARFRRGGSSS